MKTIIIPTDFSVTSKNAVQFAAEFAQADGDVKLILFYEYDNISVGSDSSPVSEDPNSGRIIAETALHNMIAEIVLPQGSGVNIQISAFAGNSFLDSLEHEIRAQGADLVIMGITEDPNALDQFLTGSNTLKLVNRQVCPVLIIPATASFKGWQNVLFAADYKQGTLATSFTRIQSLLDRYKPFVHIVNVDEMDVQAQEGFTSQKAILDIFFQDYSHEFYYLRQPDFTKGINVFVADKSIDLIIAIAKDHSFPSNLFQINHTKQLAYHSSIPVLAVHG
ncbi:MAG: universal stress protein [Chitinophagaceae bacterium]